MKFKMMMFAVLFVAALATFSFISDESDAYSDEVVLERTVYSNESISLPAGTYQIDTNVGVYFHHETYTEYIDSWNKYVAINEGGSNFYFTGDSEFLCKITKIDGYLAKCEYDDSKSYSKLSVKAGAATIDKDVNLVMDDLTVRVKGINYVPFDCDDAYFSIWGSGDERLVRDFNITQHEYGHKDGKAEYNGYFAGLPIYLPVGTYTLKFSWDGYIDGIQQYNRESFEAGVEREVIVKNSTAVYFNVDYIYNYDNDATEVPLYYSISPEVEVEYIDDSYELKDVRSSTTVGWYYRDFELSSGTHDLSGGGRYVVNVIKGSPQEEKFLREVVDTYTTSPSIDYSLGYTFSLDSASTVRCYTLSDPLYSYDYYYVDGERIEGEGTPMSDEYKESFYVAANKTTSIAVKYDSSKYKVYLVSGESKISLPDSIVVNINVDVSREYTICVDPLVSNSIDSFYCTYQLYLDGLPESDDNAVIFAVVAIVICAVFFGLLLISGKKPKWKD